MSTKPYSKSADTFGRKYARLSALAPGDKLICDDGFTCLAPNKVRTVWSAPNAGGLYICCAEGRHYLEVQLADDGDSLIGLYPVDATDWEA